MHIQMTRAERTEPDEPEEPGDYLIFPDGWAGEVSDSIGKRLIAAGAATEVSAKTAKAVEAERSEPMEPVSKALA